MALKKDKQKILGEFFDDERIRSFLDGQAPEGTALDFHLLERAYRGMQTENFATFLRFFIEDGHDLNATNADGKTLLSLIQNHSAFVEYAELLEKSGAHT